MNARKEIVVAVLLGFFLALTLYPTVVSVGEYDPWSDINSDGKIRVDDILDVALRFGSDGDSTRRVVMDRYCWNSCLYELDIPARSVGSLNVTTAGYREITLGFSSSNYLEVATGFLLENRYVYVDNFNISKEIFVRPANTTWIEPSEVALSANAHPTGYRFNVTAWTSLDVQCCGWQILLFYNRNYLNATGAGYTRPDLGKSDFFKNMTTYQATPVFEPYNSTHDYVLHYEHVTLEYRNPGFGSLCWIEFEVISCPTDGETYETILELGFDGTRFWWLPYEYEVPELGNCVYKMDYLDWSHPEHDIARTYSIIGPQLNARCYNPNRINMTLMVEVYITT